MLYKLSSYKELGVRVDNLQQSVLPYTFLFFVLALLELAFLTSGYDTTRLIHLYFSFYSPLWLVIPISILQEVVFMGYGMALLKKKYNNKLVVISVIVILFTLAHIVFPYSEIILPGAFIAGIGFATTYYYYPNLYLISLVHVLLNFLPVLYCTTQLISCS